MRKFLITGLFAAAAAVPVLAQTATPVAPAAPIVRVAPTDRVVTRAEVDAKVRAHFVRLDANRDGFVTTEEMTAQRGARKAERQARKVQRMSRAAQRDPNAAFDRLDANRDGMISRDEFAKGREVRIQKRIVRNQDGAGRPGAKRMGMHRMGGGMGGHMLKMADANHDGRVSLAEATAGAMQHFDKVDANRDGRITRDERRDSRIMIRQMRAPAAS